MVIMKRTKEGKIFRIEGNISFQEINNQSFEYQDNPEKNNFFHHRFEKPLIQLSPQNDYNTLKQIEKDLEIEMAKPENKNYLPGYYLLAMYKYSDFLTQYENLLKKKNINPEEYESYKKIFYKLLNDSIELLSNNTLKYSWMLAKGYSTTSFGKIMLADLQSFLSHLSKDPIEKKIYWENSMQKYFNQANNESLPSGLRGEYKLIYILKAMSKNNERIFIRHGSLYEDNSERKSDLIIYKDKNKIPIQIYCPFKIDDYTEQYFNIEKKAKQKKSTVPVIIFTIEELNKTLKNEKKEIIITKAKNIIKKIADQLYPNSQELRNDFIAAFY